MTKCDNQPQSVSSTLPAKHRTAGYSWYVACLLSFAYLLSILDRYLLSVVIDDVKRSLALSDTQLGILLGPSFVIMFVVASLPFGWLADRANRKRTIVGGMLCWSVATAWCGMATSFSDLFKARLLVGFGEAALLPSALSLIAAYFDRGSLGRGIAIFSMGASFGRATAFAGGGLLFTWLIARGGFGMESLFHFSAWQGVFITAGVGGLVFTFIFLLTIREPARALSATAKPALKDGFMLFWRQRIAYLAIFIPYSMTAAMGSLMAGWSIAFYTRQHGLDVATASALVGFTGLVFGPVGHLAGGWINDRLRGRGMIGSQPYVMAGSLTAAMIAATAFALAPNVKVAALSYGLSYGLLCASGPTGFSGIQLPTPERQRGVISSIFLMTYNALGNGLGPFLVGVVGDSFFSGPEQLGSAMAASIVIVLAIGLPFAILCAPAFDRAVRAQEQEQEQEQAAR